MVSSSSANAGPSTSGCCNFQPFQVQTGFDLTNIAVEKVKVERIVPNSPPKRYAICLAGENACPPEDVGGPYGYFEYLVAINDKTHPEHEQMIEWRGEGFDPTEFDVDVTNTILKTIRI